MDAAETCVTPADCGITAGTELTIRFVHMSGDLLVTYDRTAQLMMLNVDACWEEIHQACMREFARYNPDTAINGYCPVVPLPRLREA